MLIERSSLTKAHSTLWVALFFLSLLCLLLFFSHQKMPYLQMINCSFLAELFNPDR